MSSTRGQYTRHWKAAWRVHHLFASEIERVIQNELDDYERAIKHDDKRRALSELDDAVRKLKKLPNDVRRIGL